LVQFACLQTKALSPTTATTRAPVRWVGVVSGNDVEKVSTLWAFASSNWKEFKARNLRANDNGTTTVQRQVNGSDVGSALTFTSGDSVPITKTDSTIVAVTTGDRLAIRFTDTDVTGSDSWINTWSYIEFAINDPHAPNLFDVLLGSSITV